LKFIDHCCTLGLGITDQLLTLHAFVDGAVLPQCYPGAQQLMLAMIASPPVIAFV
jgi:hypothetical protein